MVSFGLGRTDNLNPRAIRADSQLPILGPEKPPIEAAELGEHLFGEGQISCPHSQPSVGIALEVLTVLDQDLAPPCKPSVGHRVGMGSPPYIRTPMREQVNPLPCCQTGG